MADFTFLFNRKGAIYPLDFSSTKPSMTTVNTRRQVQSINNEWPYSNILDSTLIHICCKVLVNMPPKEFDRVTDNIPAELFVPLFKASLYPVRDTAIDVRYKFIYYVAYFVVFIYMFCFLRRY